MTIRKRLLSLWVAMPLMASVLVAPAFAQQPPSIAKSEAEMSVRRALERLPYYGVFDLIQHYGVTQAG